MLSTENFTEFHVRELQNKTKKDPILLERAVYAFGLLEALARVNLPFIFKGGTCLMLLFDQPKRLSTDIDIIVEPETPLDEYLGKASSIFPFVKVNEQKRIGKNKIEKRHFEFTYNSPISNNPLYILLDVLFEKNHYEKLIEKEIENELIITTPEYLKVKIPSHDCILADKLTAFAPHTIGIPLNSGKDMEVIKQLYDVISLVDVCSDIGIVRKTYNRISKAEMNYLGITITPEECLWDSFNAVLCIAARGKIEPNEYMLYVNGIRDLRTHIYANNFSSETASISSAKIMYFILCLLSGMNFERIKENESKYYINQTLTNRRLKDLRYLRKISPEAYAYIAKTDKLLSENQ